MMKTENTLPVVSMTPREEAEYELFAEFYDFVESIGDPELAEMAYEGDIITFADYVAGRGLILEPTHECILENLVRRASVYL
jgi:hypothetical protein